VLSVNLNSMKTALFLLLVVASVLRDAPAQSSSYRLAPTDEVEITVYDEANLSGEQRVDGAGQVNLPLIGAIKVSGKTIREAEDIIERSFVSKRILRSPQVTVVIKGYAEKVVTVMGQVKTPGPIKFPPEMSTLGVVDAISRAGGFSGVARKTSVSVTRYKGTSKEKTYEINVLELLEGGSGKGFKLYPGDIVFVPERRF